MTGKIAMCKGKLSRGAVAILYLGAVAAAAFGLAERARAATFTWTPGGADLNWSDNGNWGPAGSPSGSAVLFTATGGAPSGVTSVVDTSFTIGALTFSNTVQQSLSIPAATTTLTSSGSFVFANTASNQNNTLLISGSGALVVSNSAANFQVGQFNNSSSSSVGDNLNMSGLGTFTFSGGSFQVGGYGSNPSEFRDNSGTVSLASTSSITANVVYVGFSNGANGGPTSVLNLSTGTNTIAAGAINVALSKSSGSLLFAGTASPAPAVTINGTAGATSRVPMTIGDHNGGTGTGSTGVVDFSRGQVNAMISTLIDGGCDNTGSGGKGTGTFILGPNPNSVVDVTTVEVGEAVTNGGSLATGTLTIQGGTFRFGTFPAELGTQNINFQGGTIASNAVSSTMVPGFNLGSVTAASSVTFGQLSGAGTGTLIFSGPVSLVGNTTVTANVPTTISGGISGNFSLTTGGPGVLALTGFNSYSGGTTITGGTVSLGTAGTPGSSDVTVQPGGTLDASAYIGTLSIGGSLGINSGVLAYGGPLNIGSDLALNSGTLTGSPANTIAVTGGLTLGGVTYIVPNAILASGTYPIFSNFTSLSGGTANLALAGPFVVNGSRQTLSFDTSTGTAVNLIVNGSAGNLQWVGGANSTWDTLTSQNWLNLNGGTLDYFYPADNTTFTDTPGTATTVNINGTVQPGSVMFSNAAVNYTLSGTGSIIGGTALTINGPGTVTIANSNTYSGGTNLVGGQLNINNANALGTGPLNISGGMIDSPAGPITIAGNAESWTNSFTFVGSNPLNTGTGAVTLVNSPTVTVNAGTLTVGGGMAGASGLTISGAGLFLSTAANSYNGATAINSGTLQLGTGLAGQDGSLSTNGVNLNTGTAIVYNIVGNQTAGYTFTGAGSLTKLGPGNLALSLASSTFTGTTTVNGGTLTLANGGQNGTALFSPITVASGAYLNLNFADALGYGAGGASVTISGVMNKINAQSETLNRPIILSGGTMTSTTAGTGAPNGAWNFFGNTISTAPGTTNYLTGVGDFAVRTGTASFNLGANSTLTITVPVMEYTATSSPNFNITGPGTMILAGTNTYGTNGGTATAVQVGFNSLAGNLLLAGSSNFPRTADGSFQVGFGSTLTISNSATALVQSDLKLGSFATGSSGTANQNGGTLVVSGVDTGNNNRSLVIGEFPSETSAYNLSAGSLSVPSGWTYVGWNGTGMLNISGGTATLGGLNFGSTAPSALNLSGNGLLSIGGSGISNSSANASATISGGTLQSNASWNTTLPMTLNGPATVGLQGNTVGFNGAISGSGSVALVGPGGTLLLGASNSYTGGTTVPAGFIVRAGNNNAFGTGPLYLGGGVSANGASSYSLASPLVLGGGTLGDITNNGGLTFTASTGTLAQNIALAVNSPVTINGGLTDGGGGFGLTKNGTGTLTLAGNNTFSGSTAVNSGGLYLNGANATTSIYVSSAGTLGGTGSAAAASVNVDSTFSAGGVIDLSQNGPGTMTVGNLSFVNKATIDLPVFTSTSSVALQAVNVTPNGANNSVQFDFPQTLLGNGTYRLLAYSGVLGGTGSGAFYVNPGAQPILGGRQSGNLVNNGSELDYVISGPTTYWNGQQPDWRSTNAWTLSPGGGLTTFLAFDNDVFDDTAGSGAFGTSVIINQGNVNPISVTFSNATTAYTISGSNGITGQAFLQVGAPSGSGGSVTISNSNAYIGGTQLNLSTLNVNNSSAIGTGILTIAGGTLGNTSGGSVALSTNNAMQWNADFTFNGPYDLSLGTGAVALSGSRTITLAAGNLTIGGPIGGTGASLTVTGNGGLILGGANTYNSGTFILGGTVTAKDNNSPLGSGLVTMSPASGAATLNLTGTGPTVNGLSSGGAGTSMVVLGNAANPSATTLTVNNNSLSTFGGAIGDLSQTNAAAVGNLVVNGTGMLTLSGSNTYTGSTTVAGGTLQLGSAAALYAGPATGNAIVNGTLDLNGYSANVGGLSGTGIVLSSVPATATLTAGYNNATSTFGGTIQNSVQGLTKTGSGVLTLTGAENAPAVNIGGGTLQIGNGGTTGSIAAAAAIVDNAALVYNLGNAAATLPSGGITGSGIVSVTTGGSAHSGGIVMLGSVVTGGSQSYDATVATHARGTGVEVGGPGAAVTSGTYTLATTAAGGSITLIGDVGQDASSPPQNLVLDTSAVNGTINLNISIGYAGDWFSLGSFTANAGTGAINWTGAYAAPAENQTTPISLTGAINFSSNFGCHAALPMTFNPTGPSTLSGVISGPVSVTTAGPSILTVTTAETYTGAGGTTISGGTLQLGSGVAGQDGSLASAVNDNSALIYNIAGSQTASYTISGSGSVTKTGSGFVQLAGGNSYSGGTVVQNGVLQLGNASAIGTGGLAANGGTLDLASNSVMVPSFSGAAGVVSNSATGTLATLSVNQPIATTFGGSINDGLGQVGLVLQGSSTLTLSGTNGYSGGTTIADSSTLIATNAGALADGSSLTVGDASQFPAPIVPSPVVGGQSAVAPVPEPGTLALLIFGLGIAVVECVRRRVFHRR